MDTVIIYFHPKDSEKEGKVLQTIINELDKTNHESVVYSVFGDIFSTDLLIYDDIELPPIDYKLKNIDDIQDDIAKASNIIFLFPFYWDGLTEYSRKFVDKVFFQNWGGGRKLPSQYDLKNKKAVIITSMRITHILFSSGDSTGAYFDSFTISMLKLCGVRNIKWFNLSSWTEKNKADKDKKLSKIRTHFRQLNKEGSSSEAFA